jgi:hypothetical protein
MYLKYLAFIFLSGILLATCGGGRKKRLADFSYESFKDSLNIENYNSTADTANVFDEGTFIPGRDSLNILLEKIDTVWKADVAMMQKDSAQMRAGKISPADSSAVKGNINTLETFLNAIDTVVQTPCRQKECTIYAEVIKADQKLYLYIEGELKDSFKVSTGIKKYETPEMDLQPQGPLFKKYTSKKFPGGNYEGLGNMPYAVFLKGGYAIHGTTVGNFNKLGSRASHGCIRLHPNNAIIFYHLVKMAGLDQTWVTVRE